MTQALPKLDQLPEFIEELRTRHGYKISIQQAMRAQDLLLALAAHGQSLSDEERCCSLLTSVLCQTPQEQQNFRRHFQAWLHPTTGPLKVDFTTNNNEKSLPPPKTFRWHRSVLILAGLALVAWWFWYTQYRDGRFPALTRQVVNEQKTPVPDAAVTLNGQPLTLDAQGSFTIFSDQISDQALLEVRRDGYRPLTFVYARGNESRIPQPIQLRPFQTDETGTTLTQRRTTEITASSRPPVWQVLLVALLPLGLYAWWWWQRKRRMAQLRRQLAEQLPQLEKLDVREPEQQLWRGVAFRRAAQALRRRRPVSSYDLDVAASVRATIRQAGMFSPVFATRTLFPEYLILIDRRSEADQQARCLEEIAQRLHEHNVFVEVYYFNEDPRLCHPRNSDKPPLTLPELAVRYPDHHLMIFGDGHELISPINGYPQPWLHLFVPWPQRAILTPEPITHWDNREHLLLANGFWVQPATQEGLAALGESFQGSTAREVVDDAWSRAYPEVLRGNERRWLADTPPDTGEVRRLCAQLRAYLKPSGYDWLRACALYPELNWKLTLTLQQRFIPAVEREKILLAFTRLPWFRYGRVPDWLRAELLEHLTPERDHDLRNVLKDVLRNAALTPQADNALTLSSQTVDARLSSRQEFVFLSFMMGRLSHLAVQAPAFLKQLLFQQHPSLGLRTISAFVGTALLCLTLMAMYQRFAGLIFNYSRVDIVTEIVPTSQATAPSSIPQPTVQETPPSPSDVSPTPTATSSSKPQGTRRPTASVQATTPPVQPTATPTKPPNATTENPVVLPAVSNPIQGYVPGETETSSNAPNFRFTEGEADATPPPIRPTQTPIRKDTKNKIETEVKEKEVGETPPRECDSAITSQFDGYTIEDINSNEPGRESELMKLPSALREKGMFSRMGLAKWISDIRRYYQNPAPSSSSQARPGAVNISACVELVKGGKCLQCVEVNLKITMQR